ncbi:MAG: hypothetical protein SFW67_12890 [Myxococcaceae bacterium]|nr:hypothetical protein [Myxococcaceae bacterium]
MAGETERITHALSMSRLEPELEALAHRAELDDEQRRAFFAWAGMVREQLLSPATSGLSGLRERLEAVRREFRAVHAGVAAGWLARGHIDETLVCRRAFLGALIDRIEPFVGAEPAPGRLVKAAA